MTLAIGDIHGCLNSLQTLLAEVQPAHDDVLVTLGDYVDRGPDSKGVIDFLLNLKESHSLIHLMGNHEIQMIRALEGMAHRARFLSGLCGGQTTLDSYGGSFADVPDSHWDFIKSAQLYHELDDFILVHGGLEAQVEISDQDRETYYYHRFYEQQAHCSGKTVVCGHTVQGDLPTDLGQAICLDTCAYGGGWLSALELETGKIWQANEAGKTRQLHRDELR